MTRWLALLILPLLSGCWIGPDFYADAPSEQAMTPGIYAPVASGGMLPDIVQAMMNEPVGARVKITYAPDHRIIFDTRPHTEDARSMHFVALDRARGLYVVEVDPGQGEVETGRRIYGLVTLTPRGYRLSVPVCDGTRRLAPGSPVIVRGVLFGLRCIYADKAAFEAAMRNFADDPSSWTDYARVQ